jgi:hypothetical protein
MLPLGSGIPSSAPRTGQVAFTTSGAPTNHVCIIPAMFHDDPLGGTLYRARVLGFVGFDLKPPLPVLTFWFSSGFYDGPELPGFSGSVRIVHYFWQGLTVVLLRFVLVAIFLG